MKKKPKMGRPRTLKRGQRRARSENLLINLFPLEKASYIAAADKMGLALSTWARLVLSSAASGSLVISAADQKPFPSRTTRKP
jgi:hypothetical protein